MRLSFGFDQKRHIEQMSLEEQRGLLAWIDKQESFHPSKEKEIRRARAVLSREVTRAEDEEAGASGRCGVVAHLSGGALKVLLALCHIRAKYGRDPVRATHRDLEALTQVTEKTIISALDDLLDMGLVRAGERSEYVILPTTGESPDWSTPSFLSSLFEARDWKEVQGALQSGLFTASAQERDRVVDEAMDVLGQDRTDRVRRIAVGHVKVLTTVNATTGKGHTVDDVLAVARWARRMYDTGEERFSPLLNLVYITEPARFTGYLAAARSGPARREFHVAGHLDPSDPEVVAWNNDLMERMRKKGIAPR